MKLGVISDCFKLPLRDSIRLAKKIGFDGIQIYATSGEFSPDTLSDSDKKEIKQLLFENGIEISALCGDMGGFGFEIAEDNPERIEKTKRIIDLAHEFNTHVVTTHIGVIPSDKSDPQYAVMLSALTECGRYAKTKDVTLAIETGPEKAVILLQFLKDTEGGVGVNLDPANFVMVTDQDPVEAVEILKDYIVHTHAKDGKMLRKTDPKIIYGHFADGGIEAISQGPHFIETPLGQGSVDFKKYLERLSDIGYNGYLTIEREVGDTPIDDIKAAYVFLKEKLG